MRIGDVVGGVALIGLAALVGLAMTDDDAPQTITADTTPFVFESTPTSVTTIATTVSTTTEPQPPTTVAPETSAAELSPSTPPATTTTLVPVAQRAGIALRVLNAGAAAGAATETSAILRGVGFAPVGPADARVRVDATRVLFAPGRDVEAATVNEFIRARPDNVVAATADDPNWTAFGGGLSVLVVLGPPGS